MDLPPTRFKTASKVSFTTHNNKFQHTNQAIQPPTTVVLFHLHQIHNPYICPIDKRPTNQYNHLIWHELNCSFRPNKISRKSFSRNNRLCYVKWSRLRWIRIRVLLSISPDFQIDKKRKYLKGITSNLLKWKTLVRVKTIVILWAWKEVTCLHQCRVV